MALNPPCDSNGDPVPLENETLVLSRSGVLLDATIDGQKVRLSGHCVLSNLRVVFVADQAAGSGGIHAVDLPLAHTRDEKFNQPIFFCNNMSGTTAPIVGGNVRDQIRWAIEFREGGVGVWLPHFYTLLRNMREHLAGGATRPAPSAPPLDGHSAYIDPSDPSRLYVQEH